MNSYGEMQPPMYYTEGTGWETPNAAVEMANAEAAAPAGGPRSAPESVHNSIFFLRHELHSPGRSSELQQ